MNGLCDSYCKVTLQPPVKNVSSNHIFKKENTDKFILQVNQQRTRTISKNISPEYSSLLHFPGIDKSDLTKLHMHIAILGQSRIIQTDRLLFFSLQMRTYQGITCWLRQESAWSRFFLKCKNSFKFAFIGQHLR